MAGAGSSQKPAALWQQPVACGVHTPARPELPSAAPPTTRTAPLVEPAGTAPGPGGKKRYILCGVCGIMFHSTGIACGVMLHSMRHGRQQLVWPCQARACNRRGPAAAAATPTQ